MPVYAFSVVFAFFTKRGEKQLHCQTSLLDIDWNIYSAHAFASLMYTNWLISNQKQSCIHEVLSFHSLCVQVLFGDLLLWFKQFCCWVVFILFFYFFNLSLFVTVLKKCTCYGIIVNMKKGCVKGPASSWRSHLKTKLIFFFCSFYCLNAWKHNHVETQHPDKTLLLDSVQSTCCVSVCQCFTGFNRVHLFKKKKGKWALQ